MSLTTLISKRGVRDLFRSYLRVPELENPEATIRVPPLVEDGGLVGTAFDYLLRFYLQRRFKDAVHGRWVAEKGAAKFARIYRRSDGKRFVAEAKRVVQRFVRTGNGAEQLPQICIGLAKLDTVYRAKASDVNLDETNPAREEDLENLISAVDIEQFEPGIILSLNPDFGSASKLVGGADCDLVIDRTILEIKTTKDRRLKEKHLHQLIGYYLLSRLGPICGAPREHYIRKVGVYWSRFGKLDLFTVEDIISNTALPVLQEEFLIQCQSGW